MLFKLLAPLLPGLCAITLLVGCTRSLDRYDVQEFIDQADDAARKRFAPEICELRGKDFRQHLTFHAADSRNPSEMEISRVMYCREAGKFSRLRQYKLERKSIDIKVAPDRRTAIVRAEYVETLPLYSDHKMPATPDDFSEWQIVESVDESLVGIESGALVFLSSDVEATQSVVNKGEITLPYD